VCAHGCLCSLGSSACGSCWLLWVGGMVYQLRRFLERIFGLNGAWKLVRIGRLSCQRVLGGFTKCFTTFVKLQVFTNLGVGKNSTVWTGKEPLLRRSVQGLPTPSFGCAAFWNCVPKSRCLYVPRFDVTRWLLSAARPPSRSSPTSSSALPARWLNLRREERVYTAIGLESQTPTLHWILHTT